MQKNDMLRKGLVFGIIILFVGAGVVPNVISDTTCLGKTIYVDDDNTDGPWDGTQDYPYRYIQDAIDAASDGDAIRVYAGVYNETDLQMEALEVNKRLVIIGNGSDFTTINHQMKITVDDVFLQGFTVDGSYTIYTDSIIIIVLSPAITLVNANNSRIEDNRLETEIYLKYSCNNIISGNYIDNTWRDGIILQSSHNNNITSNTILNTADEDDFYQYDDAIYLYDSDDNDIPIVTITTIGVHLIDSDNNLISRNIIGNNTNGVYIYGSDNNFVSKNSITNSAIGVCLNRSSYDNIISLNIIADSKEYGIFLYESKNNHILNNNFIRNHVDAYFMKYCRNFWKGNYWNKARLFPKPIFGKLVIGTELIPWVNFDWFPAKEPYKI